MVENTGREDLMVIKFFGPDINLDVPTIPYAKLGEVGSRRRGQVFEGEH